LVINLFLPQYVVAIPTVTILAFTIPFMFAATPANIVLQAAEKQLKAVIYLSILTIGFNIICNIVLITQMGYIGAAITTVLSEILTMVVFFVLLVKRVFSRV
jgi:O-antigen/teichoic acid export membrane protein